MTDLSGSAGVQNTRGILAMIGAMVAFTVTDASMKLATETLPPSQVIVVRGVIATTLLVLFLRTQGPLRHLDQLLHPRVLQRTGFEAVFIISYVIALSLAPFANVFSILQSAPIMITAFAALIWRDPVGWRRWAAVFAGFAGVAMVIQPSPQGLEPAMALALLAAFMVAGRDLTTRAIPRQVPSQVVTLASTGGMAVAGLFLAPFEQWAMPGALAWVYLGVSGGAVALGCFLIIFAYRTAETSAVSPFRYVSVPVAILLGYAVWGHVPDSLAMSGIVLIVVCGLYMLLRERKSRR